MESQPSSQQPSPLDWVWERVILAPFGPGPQKDVERNSNNQGPATAPQSSGWLWWTTSTSSPPSSPPQASRRSASKSSPSIDSALWSWTNLKLSLLETFVDPILWDKPYSPSTLTDLLDKVLTSTWRLLVMANLLLSWTYLLHLAVVDWFLGPLTTTGGAWGVDTTATAATFPAAAAASTTSSFAMWGGSNNGNSGGGVVANLIFKMLLVSAIVAPDTLDWMILLSWYTLVNFFRSLAQTCSTYLQQSALSYQQPLPIPPTNTIPTGVGGMTVGTPPAPATAATSTTTTATPHSGIFQLLCGVLLCNLVAAASCVALFHGAGWNMVLLLTCDCALVALDCLTYLLEYAVQYLEVQHAIQLQEMEPPVTATSTHPAAEPGSSSQQQPLAQPSFSDAPANPEQPMAPQLPRAAATRRAVRLDVLEQQHARRLNILETTIFVLQLISQFLTCAHFVHLWSLHGFQSTLIDGVLALHVHTAVTTAARKMADRRHLGRIARDLDGLLETPTAQELAKAAAAGDVCCICLCTMTIHVKKVACGHMYHAQCLREVVERARSLEAAKCPLCRAHLVSNPRTSTPHGPGGATRTANRGERNVDTPNDAVARPAAGRGAPGTAGERALFRFSTEEVLPEWLPLPAFAFEVVRRPSANNNNNIPAPFQQQQQAVPAVPQQQQGDHGGDGNNPLDGDRPSFLRRLLVLAGALVPLTPEQEAASLEQLVDMFPQYDRRLLQRELQRLGSAERVANSILAGNLLGAQRGGGDFARQQMGPLEAGGLVRGNL